MRHPALFALLAILAVSCGKEPQKTSPAASSGTGAETTVPQTNRADPPRATAKSLENATASTQTAEVKTAEGTEPKPAKKESTAAKAPAKTASGDKPAKPASANPGTFHPTAAMPQPPAVQLTPDQIEAGWVQLFDGVSLFGWKANSDVNWSVADGVISADSGEPGLLVTTVPFADYELLCEFRLDKGTNSGIFLRSVFAPKDPTFDCYELNLCDDNPYPTGSLVGRKKVEEPLKTEGEWATFHVLVEGPRIAIRMGERVVLDFTDDTDGLRTSGLIGLQKNQGKVEFRNVFVRPLGTQQLFDGKGLGGWHPVPGTKSEFAVDDGTIHATGGPGLLQTENTFADFVLAFEARTNGENINSGVFFRMMTPTEEAPANGYELQIHNGFNNEDRRQAVDLGGTGAIVRRNAARWVIPDDNAWFTATLVANGPRFAVWINGLQVTDWTDERDPDENPRIGKRLEAGNIGLQAHDDKSDVQFRNLRIATYPADRTE